MSGSESLECEAPASLWISQETGVDRLLKVINKTYITEPGYGSVDLKLSD